MLLRLAAACVLAAPFCLGAAALAKEPAKPAPAAAKPAPAAKASPPNPVKPPAKPSIEAREPAGGATPGKQRQKACIAEWRALSAAEKTAQGPAWPQFYSKCVKRLKGTQKD